MLMLRMRRVDAMSDAVDNAEVMLSCISLAYKESANCRLEAQYGHQVEVEMLPLMMEKGFSPTGWLGLLVGTKLYFNFHPAAVETEDLFLQQIEQVVRSLGERGKPKVGGGRVSEGVPPAVAVQSMEPSPAPAPVRARTAAPAPAPAPAPATPPRSQQPYTPSVHSVTTAGRSSTAALDSANSSSSSSSSVAQHGALVPSSQAAALAAAAPGAGITLESMAALLEKQQDRMEERMEKQNEKIERLRQETEALRAERLWEQQLVALQARIDGLVAATLLSDDERDAIEDAMADAAEGGDEAGFAAQMAALAEKFRSDRALARQLRRKYCR
jgi:DNA-binding transcriptional MerR regulator